MINNKDDILKIYQDTFFAEVKITKTNQQISINTLQERFDRLEELKNNMTFSKPSTISAYRNQLAIVCKNIVVMGSKHYTGENLKRFTTIKEKVIKTVDKLCELDIIEFENEYKEINLNDLFNQINNLIFLQKRSILNYYKSYYLPNHIKKDISAMMSENPEDEYPDARNMHRHFVLHIGPTNSGKTYQSLEKLKQCEKGAYFGPLRLLALEVYDKFNMAGIPCNMITGEEELLCDNAKCQASTIEMFNENDYYDIVVVDEVQLLSDPFRGYNWTKVILGVKANEIHLCMAPEAEDIVIQLIERCNDTYEIHRHTRNTELIFDSKDFNLDKIQEGDALIVFSKKSVLALSAELKRKNIDASVIYGNLPPASRRYQVEMFNSGKTKVVISTDAIGMGLNLPIKRVIFMETTKFDGVQRRMLLPPEIKQIAGRAGRMGIYDQGYVTSISDQEYFKKALDEPNEILRSVYIGFPENVLSLPFKLDELLKTWYSLNSPDIFKRMNVEQLIDMYTAFALNNKVEEFTKEEIYSLITCPIDMDNQIIMGLWHKYCREYRDVYNFDVPKMNTFTKDLNILETHYKKLDLYFQFSRKTKKVIDKEDLEIEKEKTVKQINKILAEESKSFIKKCSRCGKALKFDYQFSICQKCFKRRRYY